MDGQARLGPFGPFARPEVPASFPARRRPLARSSPGERCGSFPAANHLRGGRACGVPYRRVLTARLPNPNTRAAYERAVVEFCRWCERRALPVPALSSPLVAAYFHDLCQRLSLASATAGGARRQTSACAGRGCSTGHLGARFNWRHDEWRRNMGARGRTMIGCSVRGARQARGRASSQAESIDFARGEP